MNLRRFFASALDQPWSPSRRFQTSWLLPPLGLATVRALLGLYALATLLASIAWNCTHPSRDHHGCAAARTSFSYFTVLTFWGLAGYLLAAAVYTAAHGLAVRRHNTTLCTALATPPRPLQALLGFCYSSVVVFPFVVTAVYWGFLYTAQHQGATTAAAAAAAAAATWRNVSQHALNAVFALAELVLPRTPRRPWLHLPVLLALLALYLALAYVTRATTGVYVYRFLDPAPPPAGVGSHGRVAAYAVGIALCCCAVFCLAQGLIALRLWLTEAPAPVCRDDDANHDGASPAADIEMGRTKD